MNDEHVYCVVDCKTKGCNVHHVVKYLGLYRADDSYIPPTVKPFRLPCNVCLAGYDYTHHDLLTRRGPKPPADFADVI